MMSPLKILALNMLKNPCHLDHLFRVALITAILLFTAVVNAQEINPAQMKRGAIIITAVEGKAVIIKPGAGHSPHSLADPAPIVDFILQHHAPSR